MPSHFTLATYNVKDLFDATDPLSRARLDAKLASLSRILARADADVLALQEVGSADVVRELTAQLPGLGYGEPIVGTADARGIRCAILSRLPVLESRVHTADALSFPPFFAGDPPPFGGRLPLRRGIPYARVDAGPLGPLDVLVGHFKSNRALPLRGPGGEEIPPITSREHAEAHLRSLVWRAAEALFVRGLVDDLLAADPARNVVVAGDLNDHPQSHVVRIVSGGGPLALLPCADAIPLAARFSILRHGRPQQIDHILVTRALHERIDGARFLNGELRDHGEFGDREAPPLPDSDHAALVVSFLS
jgi:endonuclease/exonuclease/phosphatase family metal-dependent hydrolase